ncbi:hypothetical protein L798_12940 [Zootermopsis nevadensis]|uniref:Uncharacterized protein n=1 Tax=Zootermopsis nevadensis TaxID=136037 RepID=A0A067QGP2_ZOONE|nr:hypothetical protein L798_12940 [Zootermopsis nevadensis]
MILRLRIKVVKKVRLTHHVLKTTKMETAGSATLLPKAENKQRWKCQLENDFPELVSSDAAIHPSYTQITLP